MKNKKEKEIKSSKKRNNKKIEKTIDFFDKNRKIIYGFAGGVLISAIITTIIWPDRIATLADGTQPVAEVNGEKITADILYEDLKKDNDINSLLSRIDHMILSEKYEKNEEMTNEVEQMAQSYYSQAESYYQMSKEDFLSQYGYKSHEDFIKDLTLNYRREKYFNDYTESLITEDEINKYYEKNIYGDIDSKHMLVTIDEDRTDEDAKKLADEIISKLNEGKTFDEVKEEYKEQVTYEELGYQPYNANIETSYMNALKNLKNDEYTTEAVKTSYGYHIIYRIVQKEKPSLENVKETIIDDLAKEKQETDENLYAKSLIELRKEKELTFYDTVIEEKYNDYLDSVK